MTEKTTHISQQCLDLIDKLGRLATTQEEVDTNLPWNAVLSNACNKDWGAYVAVRLVHLEGAKPTCVSCQALLENALKPKVKLGDIHIMPDHHLSFCGLCTCTSEGLKGAPDAEAQAFMKDGITRGSVTCTACIKVVGDTRALMQAHKNSPMGKVLAEVAEASSRRPVDKRSRR